MYGDELCMVLICEIYWEPLIHHSGNFPNIPTQAPPLHWHVTSTFPFLPLQPSPAAAEVRGSSQWEQPGGMGGKSRRGNNHHSFPSALLDVIELGCISDSTGPLYSDSLPRPYRRCTVTRTCVSFSVAVNPSRPRRLPGVCGPLRVTEGRGRR